MCKKIIVMILMIGLIATSFASCASNDNIADLVVYGTIYTAEESDGELAEAFAVKDGKYIYVGDKEGVNQYIKEGTTEVIDKTGKGMIIPGCTEGHSHYFDGSGLNTNLPGSGCSYDEVLKIIKEQIETKDIKQFVSFGWNTYDLMEKKAEGYNFAEEIEKVAPGIPVVLIDNSGHNAVCNTTTLERAGILENPKVRGGEVFLDKNGKPSGYVGDQAVYYVIEKVISDLLNEKQYKDACEYAVNKLHELGYTNVLDAFTNMYDPEGLYKAINKMDKANELKLNVSGCYCINSYDADNYKGKVDEVSNIAEKYRSNHFNPGYIKLFADGVVDSGTGWMIEPYKNVEKGMEHGIKVWTPKELKQLVGYANSKDLLVHTHAFGDGACKAMLDAYIDSNKTNDGEFRNCLGHARNIQEKDAIRAAENNIPIAENIIWHIDFDENDPEQKKLLDYYLNLMSEETYYGGYPMKSLIDKGVVMSSSTDAPAAEYVEGNIMNILEIATTGVMPHDTAKPFAKEELITVREGLKALTINGAWQLGLEKERGSVKVGKYADFVILDKNILDYKGKELRTIGDTKILNTYFEGENVYTAK